MQSDRRFPRTLVAFLVLVGAVMALAGRAALAPPSLDAALRQLGEGDCERRERLRLVEQVFEQGSVSSRRQDTLAAAMAAVQLQRRDAADRLLGADLPLTAADAACLDRASLGEPVLRTLLQAMLLDGNNDVDAAREAYRRVLRQCRSWGLPVAAELATARLQRLG
jgi:hypothetical protein